MTSTSSDTSVCPLTLKSLPSPSLDVGVVFDCGLPFSDSKCAHKCTLDALVRYIQGEPVRGDTNEKIQNTTSKGGGPVCPACHVPIISVCDGIFASETLREKACVVCFRYGKQNYFLSVPSCSGASAWSIFKKASTAQDRIAYVLGMSTKNGGLKVRSLSLEYVDKSLVLLLRVLVSLIALLLHPPQHTDFAQRDGTVS